MWIHLPEHMLLAPDPALADQGECHGGDNVEDRTDASPTQRHAPKVIQTESDEDHRTEDAW